MKKTHRLTFPLLLALLLTAMAAVPALSKTRTRTPSAKARYYYLEGLARQAAGDKAEALALFDKAAREDLSFTEARQQRAIGRIAMRYPTQEDADAAMADLFYAMKDYTDRYPNDFSENLYYARICDMQGNYPESLTVYKRLHALNPSKSVLWISKAQTYEALDSLDQAMEAYDSYEKETGYSTELTLRKLNIYMARQDTAGAIAEMKRVVLANPKDPKYKLLEGTLHYSLGDTEKTLQCYREAERIAPESGNVQLMLADYYQSTGDSVGFDNATYQALLCEDLDVEDKSSMLADYLQKLIDDKSDYARGDYLFSVLREQYPHESIVLDIASRYSAAKGNYKEAVENISYAIDQDADNPQFRNQLLGYQIADEAYDDALRSYEEARQALGPNEDLDMLGAVAAMLAKKYDKAVEIDSLMLAEISPELPPVGVRVEDKALRNKFTYEGLSRISDIYTSIGDAFYQTKDLEKAFLAYDNALFFFPDNVLALNNYAYFLGENDQDLERALEMSRKAVNSQPENPTYLDTLGYLLGKLGQEEEGLTYLRKAMETAEAQGNLDRDIVMHLYDLLLRTGNGDEALEVMQKYEEANPDNP